MIKYIANYKGCMGNEQYKKMQEELDECIDEYRLEAKENEIQELCDLIQCCYTRFNQLEMDKEDIEKAFDKHYEKESLRGRSVVEIEGKDFKDKVIDSLLVKIAELENVLYKKDDFLDFNGQTKLVEIVKICASDVEGGCSNCECSENDCLEYLNKVFEEL